ncbi:MFS transporter [Promethearchaeum syntrophicum]|uniref:MFS transporter n=1 Tax=Promethearchaeum syntrophicum TaxID=2594042 RepID=A0A5B9DH74_9ARCH|nr:MFS transporter [Candidatus Prometheoarchaeum syntrophicum]QEE18093.1 enterobactin exporter EntS [Candidatus Prometheoarchaeum syntrophicum]
MTEQLQIIKNSKTFKHYIIFLIGQLFSLFGSSVVQFAGTWWITLQTDDPLYMSISLLLMFAPQLLFGALAGVIADKYNRKIVILITDAYQAIITLLLIIFSSFVLESLWVFIIFISVRHIGQTFQRPAVQTVAPMLVPDEKLSQINGINSLLQSLIQIVSPIVGALLIGRFSIIQIMWLDVITFIMASIPLFFIKFPNIHLKPGEGTTKETEKKSSFIVNFKEGLKAIKETPGLWVLIITAIFNNLLITPLNVLLTYFIYYDHHGTAELFAIVSIVVNLGIIGGSILMSVKKNWKNKKFQFVLWHYIAFIGYAIVGLAPEGLFWLMGAGGFILLFAIPVINTFYLTYIQKAVPKEKQGRVFSLDSLFSSAATPIGMIICVPLAEIIGIGNLFAICAFMAMIIITIFTVTKQIAKVNFDVKEERNESVSQTDNAILTDPIVE